MNEYADLVDIPEVEGFETSDDDIAEAQSGHSEHT